MKFKFILELVLLSAIWGASFLFMRIASPEFGPLALAAMRTASAALFLLPFLFYNKQYLVLLEYWKFIFILSIFTSTLPFILFSYTSIYATAGLTSVLNATTPMWSVLVAYIWLKENLSISGFAGIILGFAGVFILVLDTESIDFSAGFLPIIAVLTATLCYGIAASFTKKKLSKVNAITITIGSQVFPAIVLLPFAIVFWPNETPSNVAWYSVVILGVLCTGVAYILYFRLLKNIGITKTVMVTYLIPVFGIFWGNIFLGEKVTLIMLLGGGVIILGVGLTTGLINPFKKLNKHRSSVNGA